MTIMTILTNTKTEELRLVTAEYAGIEMGATVGMYGTDITLRRQSLGLTDHECLTCSEDGWQAIMEFAAVVAAARDGLRGTTP